MRRTNLPAGKKHVVEYTRGNSEDSNSQGSQGSQSSPAGESFFQWLVIDTSFIELNTSFILLVVYNHNFLSYSLEKLNCLLFVILVNIQSLSPSNLKKNDIKSKTCVYNFW